MYKWLKNLVFTTALGSSAFVPVKAVAQCQTDPYPSHKPPPSALMIVSNMTEGNRADYQIYWQPALDKVYNAMTESGYSVTRIGTGYTDLTKGMLRKADRCITLKLVTDQYNHVLLFLFILFGCYFR